MSPPRATYRLQLHHQFTLRQASRVAPYLAELGVSHLYAAPVFLARPGSTHGYDVCDYNRINPELGGTPAFQQLSRVLRKHRLGLILDFVPNHMGIGDRSNIWWIDLLGRGSRSKFARCFDVDWNSPCPGLDRKILLPVLGDHYGRVLERGELRLVHEQGRFWIAYFDQRFPVAPESIRPLAPTGRASPPAEICRQINGQPGAAGSFLALDDLLERQQYRLAFWRVGLEHLNYRRFFDITQLAGVRIEDPQVFRQVHHLVGRLLAQRKIDGLRVDHPDGLRDPATYFARLQALFPQARPRRNPPPRFGYILAEKILARGEQLPDDWPVSGTTGYEFLHLLNGLFIDPRGEPVLDSFHRSFTGHHARLDAELFHNKLLVLQTTLRPELESIAHQLHALAAGHRHGRDFTFDQLRRAVAAILAGLPVYRTYLRASRPSLTLTEQRYVVVALDKARLVHPDLPDALFDFIGGIITLLDPDCSEPPLRTLALDWIARFQQLSGPAMAKGLEDTTFYSWTRFISLNEVGGHPDHFGTELDEFHRANQQRLEHQPHSLLATATHDTKRGEDTRARLNVLSELPGPWTRAVRRWHRRNRHAFGTGQEQPAPDPSLEYLLYQTLVGSWPFGATTRPDPDYVERIQACLLKSAREAKTHTSWIDPNPAFEDALRSFIEAILDPRRSSAFLADLRSFVRSIATHGASNSLGQTLLKFTVPGVPDLYQGAELWDFALVDPDNRRPVDFEHRHNLLRSIRQVCDGTGFRPVPFCRALLRSFDDGRIKLFVTWRLLQFRRRFPVLFARGDYQPLPVVGPRARHICAFRRALDRAEFIVVVPRFTLALTRRPGAWPVGPKLWERTSIVLPAMVPRPAYRNLFTTERIDPIPAGPRRTPNHLPIGRLLRLFPIALLEPFT
jgi:(1->4)-alpha-D-glucan 1-alpha-D-glucosylmutase